jgi:hypothetical protein
VHFYTEDDSGDWSLATLLAMSDAGPGFDGEELWPPAQHPGVLIGFFKENGVAGWNSTTGFYSTDIRETIAPGGGITVDGLYLWATPDTSVQNLRVSLGSASYLPEGVKCTLYLTSIPKDVDYSGPSHWTLGIDEVSLPYYSTSDGRTGYKFYAVISAVPEPSSILALVGGIAGLGGFALRRRRS